jgi:hypothetical protein
LCSHHALLSSAQCAEVLNRARHNAAVQPEYDAARSLLANRDIEKHLLRDCCHLHRARPRTGGGAKRALQQQCVARAAADEQRCEPCHVLHPVVGNDAVRRKLPTS